MKEKTQRRIDWFLQNGIITALVIHGVVFGNAMAANAFRFMAWIGGLFAMIVICSTEIQESLRKDGPSMPPRITLTLDLAFALILAAHGWFGYATLMFLQALSTTIYLKSDKADKDKDAHKVIKDLLHYCEPSECVYMDEAEAWDRARNFTAALNKRGEK